jgi:hypothetical protein
MAKPLKYLVSLRPQEVVVAFRRLPEVDVHEELALIPTRRGFRLRRTRTKPRFEDYEVAPYELRVRLKGTPRGTRVTARAVAVPRWRGIARAVGEAIGNVGGSLLGDLLDLGSIRERREKERSELLNLVGQTLAAHEIGTPKGPYRDRPAR